MNQNKGKIKKKLVYENDILVEETHFNLDGKEIYSSLLEYNWEIKTDYSQKPIERIFTIYNNDKAIENKTISYLSENGLLLEEDIFNSRNELIDNFKYEYDNSNRLIRKINNNATIFISKYSQNQIKESNYDLNNNLTSIYFTDYDSKGNEIRWRKYNGKNELVKLNSYLYNSQGLTSIRIRFEKSNKFINPPFPINEKSLGKEQILNEITFFKLDLSNNHIESEPNIYYLDDLTLYEYDSKNNLAKKEKYEFRPNYNDTSLTLWKETKKVYNENNDLISESYYETKSEWFNSIFIKYTRDKNNRIIKKEHRKNSNQEQPFRVENFEYNQSGTLVKYIDDFGNFSGIYKYDNIGNLIYSVYNDTETKVTIEYY